MEIFNASDIINFALRMEENGKQFYKEFAQKFSGSNMESVFNQLALDEKDHYELFNTMLTAVENHYLEDYKNDDYLNYLKAFIDTKIFTGEKMSKIISSIDNVISALDFAIQNEFDTILFYLEMKNLLFEGYDDTVQKIIEEERKHVNELIHFIPAEIL